jgi:hypothetical protein
MNDLALGIGWLVLVVLVVRGLVAFICDDLNL